MLIFGLLIGASCFVSAMILVAFELKDRRDRKEMDSAVRRSVGDLMRDRERVR